MVLGIVRLPFGVDPITEPEEVQHLSNGHVERNRLIARDFFSLIEEGLAAIAAPILTSVPNEGLWAAADCAEDVFDTAFNNDAASVFLVSIVSAR